MSRHDCSGVSEHLAFFQRLWYHPPIQSQDLAPPLALLGEDAGPCHQGQIAVLIGWIPQICYTLKPRAS